MHFDSRRIHRSRSRPLIYIVHVVVLLQNSLTSSALATDYQEHGWGGGKGQGPAAKGSEQQQQIKHAIQHGPRISREWTTLDSGITHWVPTRTWYHLALTVWPFVLNISCPVGTCTYIVIELNASHYRPVNLLRFVFTRIGYQERVNRLDLFPDTCTDKRGTLEFPNCGRRKMIRQRIRLNWYAIAYPYQLMIVLKTKLSSAKLRWINKWVDLINEINRRSEEVKRMFQWWSCPSMDGWMVWCQNKTVEEEFEVSGWSPHEVQSIRLQSCREYFRGTVFSYTTY